jgi:hypothetical protein
MGVNSIFKSEHRSVKAEHGPQRLQCVCAREERGNIGKRVAFSRRFPMLIGNGLKKCWFADDWFWKEFSLTCSKLVIIRKLS